MWVSSVTLSWPKASRRCDHARVANDPGSPRRGNPTALISLGIPKLVRFAKMAPPTVLYDTYMVLSYHYSASRCANTFPAGRGRIMGPSGLEAGSSWVSPTPLLKTPLASGGGRVGL